MQQTKRYGYLLRPVPLLLLQLMPLMQLMLVLVLVLVRELVLPQSLPPLRLGLLLPPPLQQQLQPPPPLPPPPPSLPPPPPALKMLCVSGGIARPFVIVSAMPALLHCL